MRQSHYFFAIPLSNKVKEKIAYVQDEIRKVHPFKSWVHPDDFHLTLAFLGSVKQEQLATVIKLANKVASEQEPFSLTLKKMDIFGPQKAPRVLWVDLFPSKELNKLRGKVYKACESVGFQLDQRPFQPHITLARKWKGNGDFLLQTNMLPFTNELLYVDHFVLYKTNMNEIPKYEIKKVFQL